MLARHRAVPRRRRDHPRPAGRGRRRAVRGRSGSARTASRSPTRHSPPAARRASRWPRAAGARSSRCATCRRSPPRSAARAPSRPFGAAVLDELSLALPHDASALHVIDDGAPVLRAQRGPVTPGADALRGYAERAAAGRRAFLVDDAPPTTRSSPRCRCTASWRRRWWPRTARSGAIVVAAGPALPVRPRRPAPARGDRHRRGPGRRQPAPARRYPRTGLIGGASTRTSESYRIVIVRRIVTTRVDELRSHGVEAVEHRLQRREQEHRNRDAQRH